MKVGKYRNQRTPGNWFGETVVFDSKLECATAQELQSLYSRGKISDLKRQVVYPLIPGVTYRADFVYKEKDGKTTVLDCKGYRTAAYQIKKKMMRNIAKIEITEHAAPKKTRRRK